MLCVMMLVALPARAVDFTVNSIHAYQYWPGYSGLLWKHYTPSMTSSVNSNLWPGDWLKFDFNISTTDTISVHVYVDYDNDGGLSLSEELFLIDSEPVGGSTPVYLNPNRGKTILPVGGSVVSTFYTPFFTAMSSRNSYTGTWLEPPHATVDTTFHFKIVALDGSYYTYEFNYDVDFLQYP